MQPMKKPADAARQAQIRAEMRRDREARQTGYRERALRIYPPICARCGREFAGKRLRELTVHHKDHNHENNPPDGSNWELLCLYCHDNEHEKYLMAGRMDGATPSDDHRSSPIVNPFAGLDSLITPKEGSEDK